MVLFNQKKYQSAPKVIKDLFEKRLKTFVKKMGNKNTTRRLDSLEIFAGQQELTKAVNAENMKGEGCDILSKPKLHNIETQQGLEYLAAKVVQLREGGVLWGGPPCKTWIWISRNGTGRTAKSPAGRPTVPRVAQANLQVENFCLLAALAHLRGCDYVVENPSSTLIHQFKPLKSLMQWTQSHSVRTYMGAFGSEHCKPLMLWSSWKGIQAMRRRKPKGLKPLATRKGKSITGIRGDLTLSAAYTKGFGKAFAKSLKLKKQGKEVHIPENTKPVKPRPSRPVQKTIQKAKRSSSPVLFRARTLKRAQSWRVSNKDNLLHLTRKKSSSFF